MVLRAARVTVQRANRILFIANKLYVNKPGRVVGDRLTDLLKQQLPPAQPVHCESDVRLTGGEPLVRRDFPKLAAMLAALPGVEDLSVTTNGFLLGRDAAALVAAGVNRFNVSIDSLQQDRFYEMTRRDSLPQVLEGLHALAAFPEAHPIKINAVAIRGFTETEIPAFVDFARENPFEVRFIEFMPLDADHA